ncbi:HNH endonuclease signature motif containing protein [Rahnella variigena]|uniref:HNH endonuclease signature motif containing protein n=1 Tax=Rahnella variigena TaxID=574964 RepID=UPI0028DC5A4A|nr:HNH endonuclease signature motif containing protein [Rahnella variigena]
MKEVFNDIQTLREYCLGCFQYSADTGSFIWKVRPIKHFSRPADHAGFNNAHAGKPAGCMGNNGYVGVGLNRKKFQVHRLIWLMFYGYMPECIDHINGIRHDQRIANLRNVSITENNRNRAGVKGRESESTGVYWCSDHQKYRARLRVSGKDIHIGYFDSKEDARTARKQVEIKNGFHPNHGRAAEEIINA